MLDAAVQLARERGATPIAVAPQFGSEDDTLRALRDRIVTADLPLLEAVAARVRTTNPGQ